MYNIIVGNRIPKDFFITKGSGESNITTHAGSYHLALKDAGIEMSNIMTYSSILPGISNVVDKSDNIIHGSVMETIMSVCNGKKGELLNAGIIYSWLYDRETNEKYGGIVCEHEGNYTSEEILKLLNLSLDELYYNGFSEKYYMKEPNIITNEYIPNKEYGTTLVSLCFVNYIIPIINS